MMKNTENEIKSHKATPITIHLQPGETISQALIRAGLMTTAKDQENETITIPPGVHITGSPIQQTRIIERRTTGIPFLY